MIDGIISFIISVLILSVPQDFEFFKLLTIVSTSSGSTGIFFLSSFLEVFGKDLLVLWESFS